MFLAQFIKKYEKSRALPFSKIRLFFKFLWYSMNVLKSNFDIKKIYLVRDKKYLKKDI